MKQANVTLGSILAVSLAWSTFAQDSPSRPRTVSGPAQGETVSPKKTNEPASTTPSKPSLDELLEQGKKLYRGAKFPQALAKFEAALKVDPNHDEALGLAAVTAFRVDNQPLAQQWFLRRAELPGQKPSVKAFSYYRIALSHWRQLHDSVAKAYSIKDGRVQLKIGDADQISQKGHLDEGFAYAERALNVNANYAEAHNVKNLLHTEASLANANEAEARKSVDLALESLRKAIKLQQPVSEGVVAEIGNFNLPTVRIGELPRSTAEEQIVSDEMRRHLQGILPVKRVSPNFPSTRPAKPQATAKDGSSTGVTDKGGAYSIGSGRGALTAAYQAGIVKVEVLISTAGDVVFAHVVEGRADLNGAAILAARGWKFAPARFENTPVQVSAIISFDMRPGGTRTPPSPTPTPKPAPR